MAFAGLRKKIKMPSTKVVPILSPWGPRLPSRPPSHRRPISFYRPNTFPSLWVDPPRAHTRRANHTLIRICFVAGQIVSNPAFNNQARTGAVEGKCRHAETLRASSGRRFDLTQSKPLHSVARSRGGLGKIKRLPRGNRSTPAHRANTMRTLMAM
jgi:hypothetical protein